MLPPATRVKPRSTLGYMLAPAPQAFTFNPRTAPQAFASNPRTAPQVNQARHGVNSEVKIAPLRLGITAEIFNTFRLALSIQTVCLSASLSAATISNLYASNVPAGTVTLSVPTTFNCFT